MEIGGSSSCKIGLKFGRKMYFGDMGFGDDGKSEGGGSPASGGGGGRPKKGRSGGGLQVPRCQVEGCDLDLSDAKTYYSRHKVCGVHSKTAKVVVHGLEQRFCQQCSRFHQLPEFDQGKRSCRRRLAGHNERRRKPTSGTLPSARYGCLPSSIFGNNGNSGGFLMDFSSCSGSPKLPPLPWRGPPPYINPTAPVGPGVCFDGFQDSNRALSLLSNHSSASRHEPLTHEYNGEHMVQPPTETMVQGQGQLTGWGYDTDEAHLGLGQIPGYSGEIGLGQQGGRRFDSSVDHIDRLF